MPKKVNHDERRAELAQAVWSVVTRDGVEKASIRAVAAEAGWTRGVITRYFATHDELLLFAYKLALQRGSTMVPTEEDVPDPVDRLVAILMRTLPIDPDSKSVFRIWLSFIGRVVTRPELADSVRGEHRRYYARVEGLIVEAREKGLLDPPVPPREAMELTWMFADGLAVAAAFEPERHTPDYVEQRIRGFLGTWRPGTPA